jgi:hypothetical protein
LSRCYSCLELCFEENELPSHSIHGYAQRPIVELNPLGVVVLKYMAH